VAIGDDRRSPPTATARTRHAHTGLLRCAPPPSTPNTGAYCVPLLRIFTPAHEVQIVYALRLSGKLGQTFHCRGGPLSTATVRKREKAGGTRKLPSKKKKKKKIGAKAWPRRNSGRTQTGDCAVGGYAAELYDGHQSSILACISCTVCAASRALRCATAVRRFSQWRT